MPESPARKFSRYSKYLEDEFPEFEVDDSGKDYTMFHVLSGHHGYNTAQITIYDRSDGSYGISTDIAIPAEADFDIYRNDSEGHLETTTHDHSEQGETHVHVDGVVENKSALEQALREIVRLRSNAITFYDEEDEDL